MVTKSDKIQPINADDGDYKSLLTFAKDAVTLLESSFSPGTELLSSEEESEPYVYIETTSRFGTDERGFLIRHRMEFEPKHAGRAVDRVTLKCYGLPDSLSLCLECTRDYYVPRFLEINITGPEHAVNEILSRFNLSFRSQALPTTEEIEIILRSAIAFLRHRRWSAAEMYADQILEVESQHAKALFVKGLSRAAQGDLDNGEKYLSASLELDPTDYDALYNLGNIYMEREDFDRAVEVLLKALELDEKNHPVLYRLACAYEALSNYEQAIHYYEETIETSPNPGGHFHYTGLDFTENAMAALTRIHELDQE